MKKRNIQEQISRIPSYAEVPEGVFKDIRHYKRVLSGVTRALARGRMQSERAGSEGSYLFDGFQIEFTSRITTEEIFLDHVRSKIVLKAPKVPRESTEAKRKRTMFYHAELLKSVEAMKVIGITTIYLTLSEQGRSKLEQTRKT